MTSATTAPTSETPPEPKTGKGEASAQISARLQAIERQLADLMGSVQTLLGEVQGVRSEGNAAVQSLAGLQRIIMTVLPARLLRLSREQIAVLREKAPSTKLQILAEFKAQTIHLHEGDTMYVTDDRIKKYRSLQLALVPDASSDVDEKIRDLIEIEVRSRAEVQEAARQKQIASQVAEAEAQAANLKSQLGRTGS